MFCGVYQGEPSQLRAVRADLRGLLTACPLADELILCASELAASAVVHSLSGRAGGRLTVRAEICDGQFARVEVDDEGGAWTEPSRDPERARGLDILRALTATWGIHGTDQGRTVWVQLAWPAGS
jgi:serine/threonine-protein kinase RsbW